MWLPGQQQTSWRSAPGRKASANPPENLCTSKDAPSTEVNPLPLVDDASVLLTQLLWEVSTDCWLQVIFQFSFVFRQSDKIKTDFCSEISLFLKFVFLSHQEIHDPRRRLFKPQRHRRWKYLRRQVWGWELSLPGKPASTGAELLDSQENNTFGRFNELQFSRFACGFLVYSLSVTQTHSCGDLSVWLCVLKASGTFFVSSASGFSSSAF